MPRISLTILLLAVALVGCAEAAPSLSPTAEDGGQTAEAAEPSRTPEVGTGTPSGEQPAELSPTPDPTRRQTLLPTEIIASFSSSATSVEESDLLLRAALIPVSWSVSNRPENANLVFEQALPDGTTDSVELPRSDAWVASSGSGQVAPVLPPGSSTIQLRMRLVDLADGTTLASQELSLPIM